MGTFAKLMTGLMMVAALSACGGDPEADARKQLKEFGFNDKLADCVMDEIKDRAGDFDKFADMKSDEQQKLAAQAGAECGKNAAPEDLEDVLENSDVSLENPEIRKGFVEGMTSTGAPEELANCIADEAIAKGLEMSELTDATKIQELMAACE